MALALVVREPFDNHKKGDKISDPETVASILASDNVHHVLKVSGGEE